MRPVFRSPSSSSKASLRVWVTVSGACSRPFSTRTQSSSAGASPLSTTSGTSFSSGTTGESRPLANMTELSWCLQIFTLPCMHLQVRV